MFFALVPQPLAFLPLFSRGSAGPGEDLIQTMVRGVCSTPPLPLVKSSGPFMITLFYL